MMAPGSSLTTHPRVAPPMMAESLFSGRGFFIRAAAVGNAGFDPLQLAGSPEKLVALRHAEVRHGRLAMLAATAVIAQELIHPLLAKLIGAKTVLSEGGLTPSVFNGGFDHPATALAIAFGTGVMMAVEVIDVKKRAEAGLSFNEWAKDSVAGDMQFDPLRFAADLPATERYELQEAEMLNGRLAMVAVLSFVAYEAMMAQPVVHPISF